MYTPEQLAQYEAYLQQQAETAAANVGKGGGGFIPRLELETNVPKLVRYLTNKLLSPRIYIHEKRNGDTLEWTGKCTGNWVGAPPCIGCAEKIKGRWMVVPFLYEYGAEGQQEVGSDGQYYPAKVLKRLPLSVTRQVGFYSADQENDVRSVDIWMKKIGQGNKSQLEYHPAKVQVPVQLPGYTQPQLMDVVNKQPFQYQGNDEMMMTVLKACAEMDLGTLFDLALKAERWCKGQLDHNGQPMTEQPPTTHLAELIARNLIPCPPGCSLVVPGQNAQGTEMKQAPATRPGAAPQPAPQYPQQTAYPMAAPPQQAAAYHAQAYGTPPQPAMPGYPQPAPQGYPQPAPAGAYAAPQGNPVGNYPAPQQPQPTAGAYPAPAPAGPAPAPTYPTGATASPTYPQPQPMPAAAATAGTMPQPMPSSTAPAHPPSDQPVGAFGAFGQQAFTPPQGGGYAGLEQ